MKYVTVIITKKHPAYNFVEKAKSVAALDYFSPRIVPFVVKYAEGILEEEELKEQIKLYVQKEWPEAPKEYVKGQTNILMSNILREVTPYGKFRSVVVGDTCFTFAYERPYRFK